MTGSDLRFVTDILQGKTPETMADWHAVVGYLELNRVAGYFCQQTEERKIALPPQVASYLRRAERYQTARGIQMRTWLKEVASALEHEKIVYAVLKGNVLAHVDLTAPEGAKFKTACYREGGRASNDIDLLVCPSEVGKVERVLTDLGFVQGYYNDAAQSVRTMTRREILERRMNRGETVPFQRILESTELPHIEIDINFSLDYLPNGMKDTLSAMMGRTRLYALREGGTVRSLEQIDFLVHLILHQYKEMRVYSMVMRGKDLELYKLLDIYLLLQQVSQEELYERVCAYGIEAQTSIVLKTVCDFFDDLQLIDELKFLKENTMGFSEAELVVDPTQKNKPYVWTAETAERASRFDRTVMLAETTCQGEERWKIHSER